MAISLVDTAVPMNDTGYPVARAKHIWLDNDTNLQKAIDDGLIGGGGDNSVTLTQQEYEALSEEQKLNGLYYTYDTKRIYKNGVQYGASDAEGIGYNNAGSGIQATTVQGAIDNVVKTVEDAYAKKTEIPTTLPANGGNADTVNNHTVKSDVPENAKFTDTVYDDTEVKAEISKKADKNAVLNSLEIKNGYTTAQIIPWGDGTHYRSYEDKSSNTYTDIVTNNGIALIARTENGIQTKSEEIATMDKFNNYTKNIKIGKTEDVDANNLKGNANYIFPEGYEGNVSNMPSWVKRGGGILECKSWGNYVTQVFYPYAESTAYIRSLYYYDNKLQWINWKKLCATSVDDVPMTTVSLDSSKFSNGSLRYEVKNGVCYVYITTLNAKSTFTSYDLSSSPMPKPSSGLVIAPIVSDTNGANMGFFYVGESFNFIPRCHIFIASEYGYATFSYPVAES